MTVLSVGENDNDVKSGGSAVDSASIKLDSRSFHMYPYMYWYIWNVKNMQITIDIESEVPLFTQLITAIKGAVEAGQVTPGDPLPSIRQLANDLDLNNKTVAKAYRLLERDSIIKTKGYRGTFVHPEAAKNVGVDINAWVQTKLMDVVGLCRDRGATDSEIRIAFSAAMQNVHNKGANNG